MDNVLHYKQLPSNVWCVLRSVLYNFVWTFPNIWYNYATTLLPGCNKKQVDFLMGSDGEPWVWVMGEHPDDLRIEEILEQEAREKARRQAEKEAEQLRWVWTDVQM